MNAPDKLNEVKDEARTFLRRIAEWPQKQWDEISRKLENLHIANFEMGVDFADRGRLKDALFRFKMAVYFRPKFVEAWYNLGVTHLRVGEIRQAKIALKKALSLRAHYPEAAYMLATIDLGSLPPEKRPTEMPKAMMESFFAAAAPMYDKAEAQNDYQAGPVVLDALKRHIGNRTQLHVVDVGCGTGLASPPFRKISETLIGIDVVPEMIAQARSKHTESGEALYQALHVADIRSLPDDIGHGGDADIVLCVNVAQFIGELTKALHYMAWLTKPGGIVAITIDPCGGESYGVMQKTARFAHSDSYVQGRGNAVGLEHVASQKIELYPGIASLLIILKKREKTA
jgi:predicted TPR repeat methyltransferase